MKNTISYSKVIAGTMTWGSWGKKRSTSEMVDVMHHCVQHGITSFDHADIYGAYSTESDFGKAFEDSGIARSEIQLITKCGIQLKDGRPNKVAHYQYDSDYIVWSAEQSLKKLKTDYLDLLLLHRPSPLMHPDEVSKAIQKLLDSGKIKQFGVSNFTPSQIAMIASEQPVHANQVEFSLTHVDPMYDGTFDDCINHGRMAMCWSPLGTYFKEQNEQNDRIKKVFEALEPKYNADSSQLLLAFIKKHPVGIYPVVGTSNKDRLVKSMEAMELDLEREDWFLLLEASNGMPVP